MSRVSFNQAADLPSIWDDLAGTFLKREALYAAEQGNPCGQAYHIFFAKTAADSILVTYRLNLNMLSFSRFSLKLPVTVVGLPFSVGRPGLVLGHKTAHEVEAYLLSIAGPKIVLNAPANILPRFFTGKTLPSCILPIRWKNMEEYLDSLRSHYRYRFKKARQRWSGVLTEIIRPLDFDAHLHKLYRAVFHRSRFPLEELGVAFFSTFPAVILAFSDHGRRIGFAQVAHCGDELVFMFGGMDYTSSRDVYLNMLYEILAYASHIGAKTVDFGQTAYDAKLKLGCQLQELNLYYAHSNAALHFTGRVLMPWLSYTEKPPAFDVFK